MHRRHQVLCRLFREENSRRRAKLATQRQDGFKSATFTVGDHRAPARLRLQGHDAEVFLPWKNQGLASRIKFRERRIIYEAEKFYVGTGPTLQKSPQWPVTGNL